MKITEMALRASRLTYFVALIIFVAGIATFLNFPSQEEPTVTVRDAMVTALNPGLPAERVEQLIARPIEERLRELAEVKRVTSTVRAGSAMIQVRSGTATPTWHRSGSASGPRSPIRRMPYHRARWGLSSTKTSAASRLPRLRSLHQVTP